MAQNFILHKPTVVRSRQLRQRGQGLDHFLEALTDHFGIARWTYKTQVLRKPRSPHLSATLLAELEKGRTFRQGDFR